MMKTKAAKLVHRDYWGNRLVEIFDQGDFRTLYFGGKFLQSKMSLSSPHHLVLPYTRYMMLSLLFKPAPDNILLIGLGAGSLVRFLHHHFPSCRIDSVDHSPHIIDLARGYFDLPESDNIAIHCMDGASFFRKPSVTRYYDLILLDAFDEEGMSESVYTHDFFLRCRANMCSSGLLCCNLWSGASEKLSRVYDDLTSIFPGQVKLPVPNRGNVINLSMGSPVRYGDIAGRRTEYVELHNRYGFDFRNMSRTLVKNNFHFMDRLRLLFL